MSAQHTPGPWSTNCSHIYAPDGSIIAQVHNPGSKASDYPLVANRDLMAAAPDLLALAVSLEWSADVDHPQGGTESGCPVCDAAKRWGHVPGCALAAVLAKARGEQ